MIDQECIQVRHWLATPGPLAPAPDAALSMHVANCLHCRGVLAALLAELVVAPPLVSQSCDACSDDMPAYVELEHNQGSFIAARSFPEVWWHLWTCAECSQSAKMIKRLLQAEAAGELPAAPVLPPLPRRSLLPSICLDRHFLHSVFAPQLSLGVSWGDDSDALLLSEHRLTDCQVTIHVIQHTEQSWDLRISVEPPVIGDIIVDFGDLHYRARLIDGQNAHISGISAILLANKSGPDLLISIEPNDQ